MGVPICVDNLREGWVIAENVYFDNRILIKAGVVLTNSIIDKLKQRLQEDNKRVHFIYVTSDNKKELLEESKKQEAFRNHILKCDYDIPNYISKDIEIETFNSLKTSYVSSGKELNDTLKIINNCLSKIILTMQANPNFSFSLGQYKDSLKENALYEHSYRVAQFSIMLANIYNNTVADPNKKINLYSIGTAALLHDYGVSFSDNQRMKSLSSYQLSNNFMEHYPTIPKDLLQNPYNPKYRTVYSYSFFKNLLDNSTLNMILWSSESELGNINMGLKNDKPGPIYTAAKIIFLCNLYDSLIYDTINNNTSLENVSEKMKQMDKCGSINHELFELFINNIPLYSIGVRVLLSTGEYATVVETFKGKDYIAKPIVKTITSDPNESKIIDLRTTTNITISIVGSNETITDKINSITDQQLKTIDIASISYLSSPEEIVKSAKVI